jgi:hypothetical protein
MAWMEMQGIVEQLWKLFVFAVAKGCLATTSSCGCNLLLLETGILAMRRWFPGQYSTFHAGWIAWWSGYPWAYLVVEVVAPDLPR